MRVVVVLAGMLGGLGVVGLAAANIASPKIYVGPSSANAGEQPPSGSQAGFGAATQEIRRIQKRKPKAKTGATGTKVALPAQCVGGKPNIAARAVC
jgi:hypothetical protein